MPIRSTPGPSGLYNPQREKDSCGVGFIADVKGRASRKVVSDANKLLVRMTHRGAKQGEDGDGSGIMVAIPHRFFKKMAHTGQLPFLTLPPLGRYGVAMIFLPNGIENESRRGQLMDIIESVVRNCGLSILGWRSPLPTKSAVLGPNGRATEPYTVQLFVTRPCDDNETLDFINSYRNSSHYDDFDVEDPIAPLVASQYDPESSFSNFDFSLDQLNDGQPTELPSDLERLLYLIRRKLVSLTDMYICSFSSRVIVYKGQLQSEQLFTYFDDLLDEDFQSYLAIVHARFATNTFPTWDRAHPFRRIAHNGEISTIEGNRKWLTAREGNASVPVALGLRLKKAELIPFEEPAFVTHFHMPDLVGSSGIIESPHLTRCGDSSARIVDTLAIPTDICHARRNSSASIDLSCEIGYSDHSGQHGANHLESLPEITSEEPISGEEVLPLLSSDSATLDGVIELLMMAGRDVAEAVMLLMPEAMQKGDPKWKRDFNKYNSCIMEPWDGPALIVFSDGLYLGAQLDRNGLRPGRYIVTQDDRLIIASEVGVVDIHPSMVVQKGRLHPGKMLLIDFKEGRIISDEEIKHRYACKHPYGEWLSRYSLQLDDFTLMMTDDELRRELQLSVDNDHSPTPPSNLSPIMTSMERSRALSDRFRLDYDDNQLPPSGSHCEDPDITSQLIMFGYSMEKVELLLGPMAKYASEPLGAMGNDTPLAVLSSIPQTFTDYFHQMFAQGTNPSIDPIREGNVMSLVCPIGKQGDLFSVTSNHAKRVFLQEPILSPSQFRALCTLPGYPTAEIDLSWPKQFGVPDLVERILHIREEAKRAVRGGCRLLILSDRRAGPNRWPIWASLAVGAIHLYLTQERLRFNCGIIVETAEACEVHHLAFLLSCGADGIYPYMAYQALSRIRFLPDEAPLPLSRLCENYVSAVRLGLLRIMSKLGVCTMLSYKGACFFQPIGIDQSVLRLCFDKTSSVIGGIGFPVLLKDMMKLHMMAYPPRPLSGLVEGVPPQQLPDVGEYRFVSIQNSELHANHPDTIKYLQAAVEDGYNSYRKYSDIQNALADEIELRGQLEFVFCHQRPVPLKEVESAREIVKRLVTGAMSFGALSEEAFTTVARAMNALGSRSNTGEGGDIDEGLDRATRNKTKQIGSGRFGVTSAFLCDAEELQIKCCQGAKPGEGGELPGYKVVGKVAVTRRSTPGVGLISPPPHHDMYSIEDVAQLIMDLKHGNPKARISIKLVSKLGVGVIAAGCVKAKCDHILVSGSSGATGASKLSSVKHSGFPWEIGLAETHQTLCLNGLREKVVLQVDGQLKTGRDVIFAALLGAEEFGFATQPLIAMGCQMTRKCHLNACPTGIATQDPELRKRFKGKPEHVINYFYMVAEEVRTYMAKLGFRQFSQMIGRSDLLRPKPQLSFHWKRKTLDFKQLLMPGWKLSSPLDKWRSADANLQPRAMHCRAAHDHELDKVLDREIIRRARRSLENQIATVSQFPIRNVDRTIGGLLSYEVSTRYGVKGLPSNTITVNFRGAAGQSFGCWLAPGITFRLSGDCNDFAGKGLSGGIIAVKPPAESPFFNHSDANIIIGNAALYGATSGRAFFAGVAGERFAVRNSGAVAVVEGCGDYGCEYMTRGVVVVLGKIGKNFGAGMSGGIAYLLDLDPNKVNLQLVDLEKVCALASKDSQAEQSAGERRNSTEPGQQTEQDVAIRKKKDAKTLENLIEEHFQRTKSAVAQRILANLSDYLPRFTKIFPKDMKRVFRQAIQEYVTTGSSEAAAVLDDWDTMTSHKHEGFNLQSLPYTLAQFAEKFEVRRRRLKRLNVLDVSESALNALGNLHEPSALYQYASELERSGRLNDLLTEECSEQLTQLMRMNRFSYAHWRTGYNKGLRKEDSDLVVRLLPRQLTPARRAVLKEFLMNEKRQLKAHFEALEGCRLAEELLRSSKNISLTPSITTLVTMTGEHQWETFFGEKTPRSISSAQRSSMSDIESASPTRSEVTPIKMQRLSHFKRRDDLSSTIENVIDATVKDSEKLQQSKPFLVRVPDPLLGFHLYAKQKTAVKSAATRVLDWEEISLPINTKSRLYESLQKTQASRCMNCSTPSCSYPGIQGGGCPLGNRIPTWNTLVVEGQWKLALERLLDTCNFPEFTGRVCPAPCEESCVLTSRDRSVAIKSIELAIVEKGFQEGWIKPFLPPFRSKHKVAIIGSGPAGLAAAQQLNRAGHTVTVYEKADRIGGLLTYGIPNMKLDKKKVVERRIALLSAEGICFKANTCIGIDITLANLLQNFDAVLMTVGTQKPAELMIPGRHLEGVVQGLEFLIKSQQSLLNSDLTDNCAIDAVGKRVVVIGSGDIAVDCVATAVRMGCTEVIQFLEQAQSSTNARTGKPKMFKVEYGHEEAIVMQGKEPREFGIRPIEFVATHSGIVSGVKAVRVHTSGPIATKFSHTGDDSVFAARMANKQSFLIDIKGTERVYPADLVLLAIEGSSVDSDEWNNINVPMTEGGLIRAEIDDYSTGINGLFACGDCRMGPSLVVSAIAEGREAARVIDNFLKSRKSSAIFDSEDKAAGLLSSVISISSLPSTLPSWTSPIRRHPRYLNEVIET